MENNFRQKAQDAKNLIWQKSQKDQVQEDARLE